MAKILRQQKTESSENFRQWDNLINQIVAGNVIPVIGPDFLVDDEDYPDTHNAHEILIRELAEYYGVDTSPKSFSELFFALRQEDKLNFYSTLGDIFEEGFQLTPSRMLKELLSIRQFPFVITTSFTPVVEDAMREIWGPELRTLVFCNNPQKNQDIHSDEDIRKPTVMYMFGKVNKSEKTYVVTDTDMLHFCKSWLTREQSPELISAVLQNKYLLFLGNKHSDWLCRFVWFSLKSSFEKNPGMIVDPYAEDSLLEFLKRVDAFAQKDVREVTSEIKSRLKAKLGDSDSIAPADRSGDVFISYSRTDKQVAARLRDTLESAGITVWYDTQSIGIGDKFMREIRQGIRNCKFFVPLITHSIENERNEAHVYRQEWETAIERASEYGRTFICPVSERGFDFYNSSLPEKLMHHNVYMYDPANPDFSEFARLLKEKLDQI